MRDKVTILGYQRFSCTISRLHLRARMFFCPRISRTRFKYLKFAFHRKIRKMARFSSLCVGMQFGHRHRKELETSSKYPMTKNHSSSKMITTPD